MADPYDHPIDAEDIEALTQGLLADLDKESAVIDQRVADAERVLSLCESQREDIDQKRQTILQAKAIQIAYLNRQRPVPATTMPLPPIPGSPLPFPQQPMAFGGGSGGPGQGVVNPIGHPGPNPIPFPPPPPPPWVENRSKTRARIGPQRYFILTDIHQNGPTTAEEIAARTELSVKRVKDQVRSDIADGVLDEVLVQTGEPIGGTSKLRLSNFGGELLQRFIDYRKNNNIPLPTKADALGQQEHEGIFS